jgi:hypothetical protein
VFEMGQLMIFYPETDMEMGDQDLR